MVLIYIGVGLILAGLAFLMIQRQTSDKQEFSGWGVKFRVTGHGLALVFIGCTLSVVGYLKESGSFVQKESQLFDASALSLDLGSGREYKYDVTVSGLEKQNVLPSQADTARLKLIVGVSARTPDGYALTCEVSYVPGSADDEQRVKDWNDRRPTVTMEVSQDGKVKDVEFGREFQGTNQGLFVDYSKIVVSMLMMDGLFGASYPGDNPAGSEWTHSSDFASHFGKLALGLQDADVTPTSSTGSTSYRIEKAPDPDEDLVDIHSSDVSSASFDIGEDHLDVEAEITSSHQVSISSGLPVEGRLDLYMKISGSEESKGVLNIKYTNTSYGG